MPAELNVSLIGPLVRISMTSPVAAASAQADNVVLQGFAERGLIINEGIAEALTKYHQRNLPKICSECVWRYACAGGCEVMAQEAGRVDRPSLHCNFNKEILSSLLILEGRGIQNAERKRSAIKAENITSAQESIHNLKGESDDRCTE